MTSIRLSRELLIDDIRKRFRQGHIEATVERVQSIAERATDPTLLRQLIGLTCEALLSSPPRKQGKGRPSAKHLVITKDGAADLDETPPMTKREQARYVRDLSRDHAIFEQVEDLLGKLNISGALTEVARVRRETEPDVRKAYYRVKNALSLKI